MYCTFLRKRHKQSKIVFYCKNDRQYIKSLSDCQNCLKRKFERNKGIRKVSAHKETVTEETYNFVFNRDNGKCRLCGTTQELHLHHIDGRGKNLTNNVNNCIMLCNHCHNDVVHKNQKKYRPILKKKLKGEDNGTNKYNF